MMNKIFKQGMKSERKNLITNIKLERENKANNSTFIIYDKHRNRK